MERTVGRGREKGEKPEWLCWVWRAGELIELSDSCGWVPPFLGTGSIATGGLWGEKQSASRLGATAVGRDGESWRLSVDLRDFPRPGCVYKGGRAFVTEVVDSGDGKGAVACGREGDGGVADPWVDEVGGVVGREGVGDRGVDGIACGMSGGLPRKGVAKCSLTEAERCDGLCLRSLLPGVEWHGWDEGGIAVVVACQQERECREAQEVACAEEGLPGCPVVSRGVDLPLYLGDVPVAFGAFEPVGA